MYRNVSINKIVPWVVEPLSSMLETVVKIKLVIHTDNLKIMNETTFLGALYGNWRGVRLVFLIGW